MKKTNIAFSGFMAAILFGASASAATTQIASKTYVDNRETSILQTVSNTYETKENVANLTEQVTQLGDTINNEDTGLAKQVSDNTEAVGQLQSSVGALETTVGNKGAGLVKDVTDLKTAVGGKLDSSAAATTYEALANKSQNLNTDGTSPDKYPSAKAVVDWVNEKVADGIEINTDKIQDGAITTDKIADDAVTSDKIAPSAVGTTEIADGAVGTDDIADGAVTSDKLDGTLAGQIADISGKQDIAMGVGHENHIVTTDASGNITSAATIGQDKVTGLTTALAGKADASALEEIEQNVTNVTQQIGNAESGLVKDVTDAKNAADAAADAAGAAQDAVDALETTVDGKANKATTLAGYGITDAYTKTETDGLLDAKADETALANYATTTALTSGLGGKEDTSNKAKVIGEDNKASDTLYPTVGAITTWVSSEISDLSELPVNPGLIEDGTLAGSKLQNGAITEAKIADGAVTTDKIADGAVTEAKLSTDVQETIAGKANADDVYTKGETDSKIVELAVPQPPEDCVSESGLCVLSVTPEGTYAWVNVTAPIE